MSINEKTKPKYGRKSFVRSGLKDRITTLGYHLYREQLTHADMLALRRELCASRAWAVATATARKEAIAFFQGLLESVHTSKAVAWKHRVDGIWLDSPLPQGVPYAEIEEFAHVWADTNKIFI